MLCLYFVIYNNVCSPSVEVIKTYIYTRWPRGQRRWQVSNHGVVAPQYAWDLVVRLPKNSAVCRIDTMCEPDEGKYTAMVSGGVTLMSVT